MMNDFLKALCDAQKVLDCSSVACFKSFSKCFCLMTKGPPEGSLQRSRFLTS